MEINKCPGFLCKKQLSRPLEEKPQPNHADSIQVWAPKGSQSKEGSTKLIQKVAAPANDQGGYKYCAFNDASSHSVKY